MNKVDNMINSNSTSASPGATPGVNVDMDLDLQGLMCPMPLLKAKKALNGLEPLQVLRVQATDSGSVRDFSVFTSQSGHTLLSSTEADGVYTYLIQKKA